VELIGGADLGGAELASNTSLAGSSVRELNNDA
jgi:hypothetical protein